MTATEFSLDRVVELLLEQGHEAIVEYTGGGCATVYAGPPVFLHGHRRWTAAAGPGWFAHYGPKGSFECSNARASTGEFVVGRDDDGETPFITLDEDTPADGIEEYVAGLLVCVITKPPSQQQADCPKCQATPFYHADLHAGHIWTATFCPAYQTGNGDDCTCRKAT